MTWNGGERNGGIERRTVLRGIAATGAVGGLSTVGAASDHKRGPCGDIVVDPDSGTGDYSTIQAGIDAASAGDTVCVHKGEYEEDPDVDKAITLTSNTTPTSNDAAVVDGRVTVSEDGATVSLLTVNPSGTFTDSTLDPVGILVTASDVTVDSNAVVNMDGDSTGGSVTLNGIQVYNGSEPRISGITVQNNAVFGITNAGDADAGWPNYGGAAAIKVQGVVDDVDVLDNQVQHVYSEGWAYGITTTQTGSAPSISPTNVTVEGNDVSNVNNGSERDVFSDPASAPYPGSAFIVDGTADATEMTVQFNNLTKVPFGVFTKDENGTLDAECNWWGHPTGPSTDDNPVGQGVGIGSPAELDPDHDKTYDVDYQPWSVREFEGQIPRGTTCRGDLPL